MDKTMKTGGYVRTKNQASRKKLIEYLEGLGYSLEPDEPWSREDILESSYHVKVDIAHKCFGCLHNATNAAAAVSSGVVFDEEAFYERMKTYEEE